MFMVHCGADRNALQVNYCLSAQPRRGARGEGLAGLIRQRAPGNWVAQAADNNRRNRLEKKLGYAGEVLPH